MSYSSRETPWFERRRGSDVFYAFWYDPEARQQKRLSLRTTDPSEAARRFAAFLLEGEAITNPGRDDGITVEKALDDYWREHVAVNCAAPIRQEQAITMLKAFFGDKELSTVDIPASRNYAHARRTGLVRGAKSSVSDGTIRRELAVLAAASNHAKKWKRLTDMPSIELPREKVLGHDDEAPFFTKAELHWLIEMADGELRQFIELAYWTGARRRSIEDLWRDQIRWDQRRIVLQKAGKRSTKKRQPIVPILAEMEPALKALWDRGGDPRLFRTSEFYWPFRSICEELGYDDRARPHVLRHTRITHLLQDGVSLYNVARLVGDTVQTIERVYGHHSPDYLAEGIGG